MSQYLQIIIGFLAIASVVPAAESKPVQAIFRPNGTLMVNGKPVMPYGFYISTRHTGDIRLKCVEEIHKIGGTVVHIEGAWHEDTRFLDKAAELGLWVIAGHTESEAKLERVKKYKNHPAIIGWTLFDDANTLSTVDHLNKMNRLVKEIVPHRLTYVPLGRQSRDVLMPVDGFFSCSDFIGWEMYPVANPKAADPSLKSTDEQMSQISKVAHKAKRPYWILPQTFKWPGSRVPTPIEYRNLCYVGLINGATGVMPWSIYHMVDSLEVQAKKKSEGKPSWEEWYLPDSKDLWTECGVMAQELKLLGSSLFNSQWNKLTSGGDITAAIWLEAGKPSLLIVTNLSEKEAKSVAIDLPHGGTLESVFKGRAATLKVDQKKLTGEIGKMEVQVYRLKHD